MTQNYHSPHAVGADITASAINQRLSDLDSGITSLNGAVNALDVGVAKGDLYVFNGTSLVRVAVGANGTVLQADNTQSAGVRWGVADAPPGFIKGMEVTVGASTITIAPGVCRSDDDTLTIRRLTAAGNISINPAVVGANGIDVGALGASAWYRVYAIYNPGTDTTAGLMSTSASPVMPSGYTVKRRVGFAKTTSGSVLYRSQQTGSGDLRRVLWVEDTSAGDFLIWNAINVGASWVSQSMSVVCPPGCRSAICYHERPATGAAIFMRVDSAQNLKLSNNAAGSMALDVPLDTSQAFEYIGGANDEDATLHAQGYVDDLSVSFV